MSANKYQPQINRMKEIIPVIKEADDAYFKYNNPIMTDFRYDNEILTGYIEIGSDDYITRHGGARDKIKEIDKKVIKTYLEEQKLK